MLAHLGGCLIDQLGSQWGDGLANGLGTSRGVLKGGILILRHPELVWEMAGGCGIPKVTLLGQAV